MIEFLKKIYAGVAEWSFFSRCMDAARWNRLVLSWLIGILLFWALFIIVWDPFVHYRQPDKNSVLPIFYVRAYWMIPGVLRNFDYDTVIIGSSTSQNFHLKEFREKLGVKPVKATASGCYLNSGKIFFDLAIQAKGTNLKNVYQGLDLFAFFMPVDSNKTDLPDCFYRRGHLLDCGYWWNYDFIDYYLRDLKRIIKDPGMYKQCINPDLMFAAKYEEDKMVHGLKAVRRAVRRNYFRMAAFAQNRETSLKNLDAKGNLERNLLPQIINNPKINFIFYFPPYSALSYADFANMGELDAILNLRIFVAEVLLKFDNVKLFDFQVIPQTLDIDNYKDLIHYTPQLNSFMVESFASGARKISSLDEVRENNFVLKKNALTVMPLLKNILNENTQIE